VRGHLLALGAGASFATIGVWSRLFYEEGGTPTDLLVLRFVGAGVFLWALVGMRRRRLPSRRILLLGLALGAFQLGANVALLEGYDRAPASLVVLLFYVYPVLVTIGSALIFGEEFGLRRAAVVTVGLTGIALTAGTPSSAPAVGILLGLAAGVATCGYVLGSRAAMRGAMEAIELSALMYLLPALGLAVFGTARGIDIPSPTGLGLAAGLVVIGTVLPMLLFYTAIKLIGAGTTSLLATVEPLVAVVLAYLVLDESLAALQLVGGALILTAVVSLTLPARARRRTRVPIASP
jgi:drug/metabolite transporter (DMT)-like permease